MLLCGKIYAVFFIFGMWTLKSLQGLLNNNDLLLLLMCDFLLCANKLMLKGRNIPEKAKQTNALILIHSSIHSYCSTAHNSEWTKQSNVQ